MPLYEFECSECGEVVELLLKLRARPPKCEECGGRLSKRVSAPAFQFKGSGWYVTDYAGKGKTDESTKSDDADAAGSAPDGDGKSDSSGSDSASKTSDSAASVSKDTKSGKSSDSSSSSKKKTNKKAG